MCENLTRSMQEGDLAPNFELRANDGNTQSLASFKNKKNVVLCFYPKKPSFCMPIKKGIQNGKECDFSLP